MIYLPHIKNPSQEFIKNRLSHYWQCLGITDSEKIATLNTMALKRADYLATTGCYCFNDPVALGLMGAYEILNDFIKNLTCNHCNQHKLYATRAALISGMFPNWQDLLLNPSSRTDNFIQALEAKIAQPIPKYSPCMMPTQHINLFSLLGMFIALCRRLFHL